MKRNLLKTLLVAVGLAMGSNSMAKINTHTVTLDPATSNFFIDDSRITSSVVEENNESVIQFLCAGNAQNGYSFSHCNFSELLPKEIKINKLTFDIDYYNTNGGRAILTVGDASVRGTTGGSSKVTYNSTGAIFAIGSDKNNALINGAKKALADYTNKWMHITLTVNLTNKKINYTIKEKSNDNLIAETTDASFYSPDNVNNCTQIDLFGYINNSNCAKIGKVNISVEYEEAAFANYTIKYVDTEGKTIDKETRIANGLVGETTTLTDSDKLPFITEDGTKKYIYVNDDAETQTIAEDGSTIVTVTFREAATWNYTVNTVVAGNTNKIAEGSDFEEEIAYVNYPRYYNIDGILYSHEAKGNNGYYSHSFTIKSNNQIENINGYQAVKENIVYYNEAESINGLTMSSAANSDIRCSNGKCAYNANEEAVAIVTLRAGKYRLYTSIWGSAGTEFIFKANDVKIESSYICSDKDPGTSGLFASKGYIQDYESKEFTLSTETAITLETTTDGSRGIDFIYIQRTGDATETVSVTDAGMATYCPAVALDFTGATKIAAYKASVSGNTVTLTKVSTVAAGEGVLIRALNDAATTEDIVIAAEAESNAGNDFTGVQAETTLNETDGEYTNYVLSKEGETVGFFKARPEADGGTKLAAGKAYLKVLTTNAAKGIKVIFDGETTGIGTIKDNTAKDNAIYNLNGQRVASPEKGLYIMNGKKIIVK